jgi:hypothetical protein
MAVIQKQIEVEMPVRTVYLGLMTLSPRGRLHTSSGHGRLLCACNLLLADCLCRCNGCQPTLRGAL